MMRVLHTTFLDETIAYTGAQLASGWLAERWPGTPPQGDLAAAFVGPCDVDPAHMVDLEDLREGCRIRSASMLHVVAEHPGASLEVGALRQRLLCCLAAEWLNHTLGGLSVVRRGDDLFHADRKLSISVATASASSALIHFAVNVHTSDDPLPVKGLADYGIAARAFGDALLEAYAAELAGVRHATGKVRRVGVWQRGERA